MQLPEAQIELAASTETSRYTLKAIKFDVERKRIMATDGHIAAIVPCEPSADDHSALIPLDAVKNIRAMQKRAKTVPVNVHTNSKITAQGVSEVAEFEAMLGQFPNVDIVVPKYDAENAPYTICLDVEKLLNLAKAMVPKGDKLVLKLWIKDQSSSVLAKAGDAVGVIMPCRG